MYKIIYSFCFPQCEWFTDIVEPIFSDILFNHFPFHYSANAAVADKRNAKLGNMYDKTPGRSSDDLNVHMATIGVKFGLLNTKRNLDLAEYVQSR